MQRRFSWWLTTLLAPVGVVIGPIGIASTLQSIIEWTGPIAYTVELWSTQITPPFQSLFGFIADIVGAPQPSDYLTDYLILAILNFSNFYRGVIIAGNPLPGDSVLDNFLRWTRIIAKHFLFWPYGVIGGYKYIAVCLLRKKQPAPMAAIYLMPTTIFVVVFAMHAFQFFN